MRTLSRLLFATGLVASISVVLPQPILADDAATEEERRDQPCPEQEEPADQAEDRVRLEEDEIGDPSLSSLIAAGWLEASEHLSIHDLLDLGREADKPLLLLFRLESCKRSWALERGLLEESRLRRVSERFVRAVVDTDSAQGRALAATLRVPATPTILVLTGDQLELARVDGGEGADSLFTRLRAVAEGSVTIAELERAAIRSPFDIHLAFELGRWHALRGDSVGAKRHFARIFVLRRMLDQSSRALVRGAADVGRLGDSADFGPVRSALETDLAGVHEEVDTLLASAYFMLGEHVYLLDRQDPAQALRIFDDLRRRFPDSPESRRAALSMALAHQLLGSSRRSVLELTRHRLANYDDPDALAASFLHCLEADEMAAWAAEALPQELENHPHHADLHHASARLHERAGDLEEALLFARRAAALQRDWAWYRKEAARLEALQPPVEETPEPDDPETAGPTLQPGH